MLEANLYNNKRRLLGSVFGEIQLQAGVSEIKINGERGEKPGFQPVLNILRRSEAALLQRVSIDGIEKVSPDYLAFLVWIASNTHTLAITNCTLGDCGFACLMSGILLPNGLTKLNLDLDHYDDVQVITRHQWKLLFEAVASSSSLETLWINADFEDIDDMGLLLVHTLRRNRSMTDFSLNTQTFYGASTTIPDLLTAAVLQTKVKALKLGQSRTRTLSRYSRHM